MHVCSATLRHSLGILPLHRCCGRLFHQIWLRKYVPRKQHQRPCTGTMTPLWYVKFTACPACVWNCSATSFTCWPSLNLSLLYCMSVCPTESVHPRVLAKPVITGFLAPTAARTSKQTSVVTVADATALQRQPPQPQRPRQTFVRPPDVHCASPKLGVAMVMAILPRENHV